MDMRALSVLFAAIFIFQAVLHPHWAILAYPAIGFINWLFIILYYANDRLKLNRLRLFGLPLIVLWLPYAIFPARFKNAIWRY